MYEPGRRQAKQDIENIASDAVRYSHVALTCNSIKLCVRFLVSVKSSNVVPLVAHVTKHFKFAVRFD